MKSKMLLLGSIVLLCLITGTAQQIYAQENQKDKSIVEGFGIGVGLYNPEMDYWKNNTNSEFKEADFSTNIIVQGFAEFSLIKNLNAKAGLAYWQTRAETTIPRQGKTTMLLTGTPISLDLIYYIEPARLFLFTPYAGIGGEFLLLQYSLDFDKKENPDPVNGTSAMLKGQLGIEARLSDHFSIDLTAEYKSGTYEQSFVREVPDPESPSHKAEFTEVISLSGPVFNILFKYHF